MRYRRRSNISLTGSVRTTRLTVVGVQGPKVSRSMTYAQVANIATMTDGFMDGINISAVDLQTSIVGHMQNISSSSGTFQGEYSTSYIDFKLGFVEKFPRSSALARGPFLTVLTAILTRHYADASFCATVTGWPGGALRPVQWRPTRRFPATWNR